MSSDEEILAVIRPTPLRRAFGVGTLGFLGVIVVYLAAVAPNGIGWTLFLVALGILVLLTADTMRRATGQEIQLTETELRDSDGTRLALVADIERLDRGVFAFKPSNGFLIRTRSAAPRAWRPGLWWRVGRRIGVGGVVPGGQAKFMAEMIQGMIALRKDEAG